MQCITHQHYISDIFEVLQMSDFYFKHLTFLFGYTEVTEKRKNWDFKNGILEQLFEKSHGF